MPRPAYQGFQRRALLPVADQPQIRPRHPSDRAHQRVEPIAPDEPLGRAFLAELHVQDPFRHIARSPVASPPRHRSDIARLYKAVRPTGWRKARRALGRGLTEVNQLPRQLAQWATGQPRIAPVAFAENPPAD